MPNSSRNGVHVVTGGAGAIGSVLVRSLLERGHEVRVVDNLSSGRRDYLPDAGPDGQLKLFVEDVRKPEALLPICAGAESVWHLAANPDIRRGTEDPRIDLEHGTIATFNVLQAARAAGARRFLYASSSVVYGLPRVFPTPEEYGPLLPESNYGASKLAGEAQVSGFALSYGFRGFIFRFANIIGPTMTHGVIFDFLEKLRADPSRLEVLGDGRQAKSYLTSDECVEAMLLAYDRAKDPVNVLNVGSRDRVSVREIAETVVRAHGGKAKITCRGGERGWTGDIPQQLLSIERLGRLGWSPKLTSAEAVDRTVREMTAARRASSR